ncbi:hypothetical protein ACM64Y_15510 [Novispirillum sp. DQ9]|uniref:hypothetical protein n=1 Tax=Novispirillum sp. DQ9 TaxID=3398612 RepID=UPI003C7A443E
MTRVRLSDRPDGAATDVSLCPCCLATRVDVQRRLGGRIEAVLDGGRVVRW